MNFSAAARIGIAIAALTIIFVTWYGGVNLLCQMDTHPCGTDNSCTGTSTCLGGTCEPIICVKGDYGWSYLQTTAESIWKKGVTSVQHILKR